MEKIYNYKLPLLAALMVIIGMFVGARFKPVYKNGQESDPKKKFEEVLKFVESAYVDTPNDGKLTDAAIEAMLKVLDPHSVYIPAKDLKETNEELEGSFEGVGIEFNLLNDTIIL
jgi:carboxyl-terminal processing protease